MRHLETGGAVLSKAVKRHVRGSVGLLPAPGRGGAQNRRRSLAPVPRQKRSGQELPGAGDMGGRLACAVERAISVWHGRLGRARRRCRG